ncbi:hypothetical protein F2Q68_00042194 [Brassica cretica]|uniref:Myb-like domain-containing protein n=1 Tax=Brassica cretica TaxID=69181 RepID=A0A8S9MI18_BRACR|nr:hypothetical protein F2Q68_00042194 [Brassica cretica]
MVRTPCCRAELGLKKGAWTPEEDQKLTSYVNRHGEGGWRTLPEKAGFVDLSYVPCDCRRFGAWDKLDNNLFSCVMLVM